MKTLEEIKNKFAKNNAYNNWSEFMLLNSRNSILIEKAMDEIITLVQKEQQKLIADNARLQVKLAIKNEPQIFNKYGNDDGFIEVNRESIINENNIIK